VFGVLTREVEAALYYQKKGYYKAVASDTVNRGRLFSITRLNSLWLSDLIEARNDHPRPNYTYYKAYLVEVVEVSVRNTVFRPYVSNQSELQLKNCRIFVKASLIVIDAIKTRL